MRLRLALGALGTLLMAYAGWLLLTRQDSDQLLSAVVWLGGGVILHDAVLAPLVIASAALGTRLLPAAARRPSAVALVVLGSVTLVAIPVLGGWGRTPTNPTLLDRNYVAGWLAIATVTVAGAVAATLVIRARRRAGTDRAGEPRERR